MQKILQWKEQFEILALQKLSFILPGEVDNEQV